jgi:hypothetical protein
VDIGYFEPTPGIYGTAFEATDSDPIKRAALQEASAALARSFTTVPGYVPPNYAGRPGTGALPKVGWTCQNATEPVFPPYTPTKFTPDWTGDPNGIGAGQFDMNQVFGDMAVNPLNRAPIGEMDYIPTDQPNPNTSSQFSQGSIGDLEY